jgi:drug/metabolite transporter (DMT)-like permease
LVGLPRLTATRFEVVPAGVWWAVVFIVLVPTALNYLINTWAVGRSSPSLAATYTTLQPLSAATLAYIFLAEHLGWAQLVGGLLIVAGLQRVARS